MSSSTHIEPYGAILPFPYAQQVARAHRFLDRYRAARLGGASTEFVDLEDSLWAFFQNCWHIKDWLRNDPTISAAVKDAVWKDIRAAKDILVVADLANGSKHFSDDPKRQHVGARDTGIQLRDHPDGSTIVDHIVELTDGSRVQALVLAEGAMRSWRDILRRHGLLSIQAEAT